MVCGVEVLDVITATVGSGLRADGLASHLSTLPANRFVAGWLEPHSEEICFWGMGMGSAGGEPPGQPGHMTAALALGRVPRGLLVRVPGLGLRPGLRSFLSFLFVSRPRGDLSLGLLFLVLWEPVDRLDRLLRRDPPDPDR